MFLTIVVSACSAEPAKQTNGNTGLENIGGYEGIDANKIAPPTIEEIPHPQIGIMNSDRPVPERTPGIPGPEELRKPFRPGPKPTPGIPDEKTIRRMLKNRANIANANR